MRSDRNHFKEYLPQTQVKHRILTHYMDGFVKILSRNGHPKIAYIDAFAGPGSYGTDESPNEGSPLLIPKLISTDNEYEYEVNCFFVEKDEKLLERLKLQVAKMVDDDPSINEPTLFLGAFADVAHDVINIINSRVGSDAPVFLFVDPCRIDGVSFGAISQFLSRDIAEAIVFLNYQAIERTVALPGLSRTIVELYGDKNVAKKLCRDVASARGFKEKEEIILGTYVERLISVEGIDYVSPFRVESRKAEKTSHYFIHATKHPLGFKLMKDVMYRAGRTGEGTFGFELAQKSAPDTDMLFQPAREQQKCDVLEIVRQKGPLEVRYFTEILVCEPDNRFAPKQYKELLIALERDGKIKIFQDKNCKNPKPASKRQRSGETTLGEPNYVCCAEP